MNNKQHLLNSKLGGQNSAISRRKEKGKKFNEYMRNLHPKVRDKYGRFVKK